MWNSNYDVFLSRGPEKIKDKTKEKSRLSLSMKRKHEGGHGKVGRPKKTDKDRSHLTTPATPLHTHVSTDVYAKLTRRKKHPKLSIFLT